MQIIYKIQQFYVQYQMRLVVNDSETSFEKLVLNIDEYHKCRLNSREISYKGNLYDVKSMNITGDSVELLAINDLKEKILLSEIKAFLQTSNQSKKELPEQLQKYLSVNYIAADEGQINYIPSFSFNIYYQPISNIFSNFPDNPSPPPKFV